MPDHVPAFAAFSQSLPYAHAAAAMGARCSFVTLGDARVLMLERPGLRLISRADCADRAGLRALARFPGALVITPEVELRGFGLIPVITPRHHAIWDLAGDIAARMAGKWRNRLRAAERAGIRVQPARGGSLLADLVVSEARQSAERGYRSLPAAFTHALPPENLRLWGWRREGQVQAAMCFVRHGSSATYHIGWAAPAARAAGVHGVMLWQAAQALATEGCRWLDLGPVNQAAPGLAHFKLGTGAAMHRLGPTLLVLPGLAARG